MTEDYKRLLARPEWHEKRSHIWNRDGGICQRCRCSHFERRLEIHHKYYRIDLLPWEYPDESLISVCVLCHEGIHATEKIPVLDANGKRIERYPKCVRCSGPGYIPAYRHYLDGICFRCWGSGMDIKLYFKSQLKASS